MKVVLNERIGYTTLKGLQFARVARVTNHMTSHAEKCKELFAEMYGNDHAVKRFRFLILLTDSTKQLNAENTQDFLNQVEAEMDFAKSKVWIADVGKERTQAMLIDASGKWLKSSPLLHLLLLLARNGSNHIIGRSYKRTLAMFRRTDKTFQMTDRPQFMIIKDSLPHIIERKGKLENFVLLDNGQIVVNVNDPNNWQRPVGIVQWTEKLRRAGVI